MANDAAVLLLDTGRKPGTSTNCTNGMLNESQKVMNSAALSEALMSRQPDMTFGWLATMPTVRPLTRAKAVTMLVAQPALTSR